MQAYEIIANFCGPRELFGLARVCARWRQTPVVAAVARVFHDALREECFASILPMIGTQSATRFEPQKGQLSVRATPIADLIARVGASFIAVRDPAVARFILGNACSDHQFDHARLAAYMTCDPAILLNIAPTWRSNSFVFGYCSILTVMRELIIQDAAPLAQIRAIIDGLVERVYGEPLDTMRCIISCANPSLRMTDCLECIASGDVAGYVEYLPYLRDVPYLRGDRATIIRSAFGARDVSTTRVRIGPVLARALLEHPAGMHHIAAQFARCSPEFARYITQLRAVIAEKWAQSRWSEIQGQQTKRRICANLICAACNPDSRVFEEVIAIMRDAGLFERIDHACSVRAWNCGAGFAELRMFVERLESVGLRVDFDNAAFWYGLRIDALTIPEAIQCLEFIIARRPDMRVMSKCGMGSRRCLKYARARFGEPMREFLDRNGLHVE